LKRNLHGQLVFSLLPPLLRGGAGVGSKRDAEVSDGARIHQLAPPNLPLRKGGAEHLYANKVFLRQVTNQEVLKQLPQRPKKTRFLRLMNLLLCWA